MALLGMGNPLLDISAEFTAEAGKELMGKYDLLPGNAVIANEKQQALFDELVTLPNVKYIAGGATLNSIRVTQWMLQEPGQTAYMGCIGTDENGERLRSACATEGVNARFHVDPESLSGVCATVIVDIERSLCTNPNASSKYKVEHCQEEENWAIVQGAKIVYSSGFFALSSPESMKLVSAEKAKEGLYCLNLAAPICMQVPQFKAVLVELMPYVDFLFCNESEGAVWAETEGWETTDVAEIGKRLSLLPSAKERKRTVVITQGADPTLVCIDGECTPYPVIVLPKEQLVDTNGAGDSYVGGFLAGLVKGLPMEECCKAAAYAASVIVQHSGCTFPEKPEYTF